jgi:diacylglycerol kinase (ATP)
MIAGVDGRAADTLVIVNPASAGGRTARRESDILDALRAAGVRFRPHVTLGRGEATRATRDAIRSGTILRIIAVGGDGTLNEVVNGCFDEDGKLLSAQVTVGLMPSGTGSDFRRTLGTPGNAAAAARKLAAGATRSIDVGRVTVADGSVRHFINHASCGIAAEVVARVDHRRRHGVNPLRRATFLAAGVAVLGGYRNREVELTIDSAPPTRRRVQQVVVANGRSYGAGMLIAPGARPDDGLLDVVIVGDVSRTVSLLAVPRLYRGTHLRIREVSCTRATSVRIVPADGGPPPRVEADGELVGTAPAEVTIVPGALRFASAG